MTKEIFIIGEIGINHNGDLDLCKKIINTAKKVGANAVKFQKRNINQVYTQEFLNSNRDSPWGKTQRDQKQGIEFGKKEYDEINRYCKEINILWFASAWDLDSLKFLKQYDLKYNKIASAMIIDLKFLEEVSKEKKHTFISTGMSTLKDIENAINIFEKNSCPFELMHCVSTYPMKPEDANLKTIKGLKKKFNCDVGYSGHENGLAVSYAAASLGITSLERHITVDRTMYGSDQAASIEMSGFGEMISGIRKIEKALGKEMIGFITNEEKEIAKKLRGHIKIEN
jgi:N-acetylneuraminate synthase